MSVNEENQEEKKQRANNTFKINNIGKMFSNKLFGNKPTSNGRPGESSTNILSTAANKKDQPQSPRPKPLDDNQQLVPKSDPTDSLLIDFEETSISGAPSNNNKTTLDKEEILIDFGNENESSSNLIKSDTSSSSLLDFSNLTNSNPSKVQTGNESLNKHKITNSISAASLRTFTPKLSQKHYASKQARLNDLNQLTKDSKTQFIFL